MSRYVDCASCGFPMTGIIDSARRVICCECGGHPLVDFEDIKKEALQNAKNNGELSDSYHFKELA